ncbi:hypothetical protein UlMin_018250 [Ulmus minor]
MRVKKQKRHRRAVRFYTACFGFRQPFKVLCDGTFVNHLLVNRITPADDALANLLGAPVKLFTTRCVLEELKWLGQSHSHALEAAQNLVTARCPHEMKRAAADACIAEVIGENNPEHFFVATQDNDLRKKFQELPGVPVIFALRNALLLDSPSSFQRQFVKNLEEERSHMTVFEHNVLKKKAKSAVTSDDENDDSPEEKEGSEDLKTTLEALKEMCNRKKGLGVKDKAQFKRKRAKGPNPLSCKKKKNPENTNPAPMKPRENGTDDTLRSKTRKRKRSRGSKKAVQAEG